MFFSILLVLVTSHTIKSKKGNLLFTSGDGLALQPSAAVRVLLCRAREDQCTQERESKLEKGDEISGSGKVLPAWLKRHQAVAFSHLVGC